MSKFSQFLSYIADTGLSTQKLVATLALAFSGSFMILFYTPLDIYLNNPAPFVVGWRLLLPQLFVLFLVGFLLVGFTLFLLCHKKRAVGISFFVLGILLTLVARFILGMFTYIYLFIIAAIAAVAVFYVLLRVFLGDRASDIILLGIFGLILSSYVQTLFLNGNMVAEAGAAPMYDVLSSANILNIILWATIAIGPIAAWVCLRVLKKELKFDKVLIFSSVIISGMQIVGLGATAATTDLPTGIETVPQRYVSFDYALHLNEDKNIVVFILDRLDVRFMNTAFAENPRIAEILDGFTHFENNTSEFFDTLPSMISMLTQHYYSAGQTIGDFRAEAWAQHNVIDTLREHGFTTHLYLDHWSTVNDLSDIENRTDNIRESYEGVEVSIHTRNLITIATRMSFGRVSPYLLKNVFLSPISLEFGNHLFAFSHDMPDAQPLMAAMFHDERLLEYIQQNEFTLNAQNPVFTLLHLNGAHAGGGAYGNIPSLLQNFEIVEHFLDNMRVLGVYDSSTILILGDHGRHWDISIDFDLENGIGWITPVTTSLFIKPAYSTGPLVTDTLTEMSNRYFAASLLQFAGLPHEQIGLSYFDILAGYAPETRRLYNLTPWWLPYADYGEDGILRVFGFYEIRGYAADENNWTFVPSYTVP